MLCSLASIWYGYISVRGLYGQTRGSWVSGRPSNLDLFSAQFIEVCWLSLEEYMLPALYARSAWYFRSTPTKCCNHKIQKWKETGISNGYCGVLWSHSDLFTTDRKLRGGKIVHFVTSVKVAKSALSACLWMWHKAICVGILNWSILETSNGLNLFTKMSLSENSCTWRCITASLRKLTGNGNMTLSVIGGRKWEQRASLDITAWVRILLTKDTKGAFKAANNSVFSDRSSANLLSLHKRC